jgi:signal transduction histidine kinase
MSEAEFKSMIERQGVHSFLITMSTQPVRSAMRQDLWLRGTIGVLATLAVFGLGLAWRNLAKSSELQIRLVRASELNSHLRELNLAAAGLAHETRNPLNIVRGLAQMISKEADLPAEIRQKSRGIVDETDRVTAQLNEFINYSRPREVRRATVALGTVVDEVVRALNFDVEEKQIRIETSGTQISIEADEQLLRQALFNLVLNAVQAVAVGGQIWISAGQDGSNAVLEIKDNGPGVPPERRLEIFKPYFTTNEKGTGLGLAVVQQIILAHGWEIACMASEPSGARFRLTHLKLANAKV